MCDVIIHRGPNDEGFFIQDNIGLGMRRLSIIQGIHKLEPGHILTVESGHAPVLTRYWDLEFKPDSNRSEDSIVEELRCILDESVRIRMRIYGPLGAISGQM